MKNNKKYLIVHLSATLFNKIKWNFYEYNLFPNNFEVEIHDLRKIYYPNFFHKKNKFKKNKQFSNFDHWKKYFLDLIKILKKKNIKLVIFKGENTSFIDLKICSFFNKNNIKYNLIHVSGLPEYKNIKFRNFFHHYLKKIFTLIFHFKYSFKIIEVYLSRRLTPFLKLNPKNFFSVDKKNLNYLNTRSSNFISFNSYNYSNNLSNKSKKKLKIIKKKYIVFIDIPEMGPRAYSDVNLMNRKLQWVLESKDWEFKIDNFFSYLEKNLNLEVVVALHPKSKNYKKKFNRKAFYGITDLLISNCELAITIGSTSILNATIDYIPTLFICSNLSKKDFSGHKHKLFLSEMLGSKLINIDDFNNLEIKKIFEVNKKKYDIFNKKVVFNKKNQLIKNHKIIEKNIDKLTFDIN